MSVESPTDERGLRVARDYARYHIGDASWANEIVRAYLNPELVAEELQAEWEAHR